MSAKHTINEVFPDVYQIYGVEAECVMYLVVGESASLLIDNGLGVIDLPSELEHIAHGKIIAALTHGHGDHSAGSGQFSRVHATAGAAAEYADGLKLAETILSHTGTKPIPSVCPAELKFVPVTDGASFELGGKTLRAVTIPGHTPGCAAYICDELGLAFTGDAVLTVMDILLDVPSALPVSVYLESMRKLRRESAGCRCLLTGHDLTPLPLTCLDDAIRGAESIVSGSAEPESIELPPAFPRTSAKRFACGSVAIEYYDDRI